MWMQKYQFREPIGIQPAPIGPTLINNEGAEICTHNTIL